MKANLFFSVVIFFAFTLCLSAQDTKTDPTSAMQMRRGFYFIDENNNGICDLWERGERTCVPFRQGFMWAPGNRQGFMPGRLNRQNIIQGQAYRQGFMPGQGFRQGFAPGQISRQDSTAVGNIQGPGAGWQGGRGMGRGMGPCGQAWFRAN